MNSSQWLIKTDRKEVITRNCLLTIIVDPSRNTEKVIRDLNDVITNYIRNKQVAVEESIKKYSEEQYELLNTIKDKAYKERQALVKIVQNAAKEDTSEHDLSPKSPKLFMNVSSDKHSAPHSPQDSPFSPKRPKSISPEKGRNSNLRDDLMFSFFDGDDFSELENTRSRDLDDSDSEEIEEAEDVVNETAGITILQGRSAGARANLAKSCPVDIPVFCQPSGRNIRPDLNEYTQDRKDILAELHEGHLGIVKMKNLARSYVWWPNIDSDIEKLVKSCMSCQMSPRQGEEFDMAASIKALARSVHGDTIFGELPRPKFSTQI